MAQLNGEVLPCKLISAINYRDYALQKIEKLNEALHETES
jgi:hypothetical protein